MICCPVCDEKDVFPFLSRDDVPVHQNLLCESEASARAVNTGRLEMTVCATCSFVFNAAFDLSRLSYGEGYNNCQTHSPYFEAYVRDLTRGLVEESGVRNALIVEVGCGNGDFLRGLVNYPDSGNRGIGFDPAYTGAATELNGKLRFVKEYYGPEHASLAADVVVSRHVIEHVPQPIQLLQSLAKALSGSSQAKVFFETPNVDWILSNQVVWDFFYEHCSLFNARSIAYAFERASFSPRETKLVFGEQYLWFEAALNGTKTAIAAGAHTVALAQAFGRNYEANMKRAKQTLEALARNGKVGLWGAGAKGTTFASIIDADKTLIDCLIDLNPDKQSKYVPGTGHAIVSPGEIDVRGVKHAILMNPNYAAECRALLASMKSDCELVMWS
jgi:SAM-dependent methyltransferase